MVVLSWVAGAIAGYGAAFSVAGMQFLLVAAIAIGVTTYTTWFLPIVWYFVGAAFYLVLMLIEFAVQRRRPASPCAPASRTEPGPICPSSTGSGCRSPSHW